MLLRTAALGPTVLLVVGGLACGDGLTIYDDPTARPVRVQLDARPAAEVSDRFLSFAIDSSQHVGGVWWSPEAEVEGALGSTPQPVFDFRRERLETLTEALAPAYLRIGGSEADRVWFETEVGDPRPEAYEQTLTRSMWDEAASFARRHRLQLVFTLNAGPGPRGGASGPWNPANAEALVRYATERGDPVAVWELGNEINAFQVIHGFSFKVSAAQYAEDVRTARQMLSRAGSAARLAGPSSAYWPEIGEVPEFYPRFMPLAGAELDLVTWHYYPQQSSRCPLQVRPARPGLLTHPDALDEVERWADAVEQARNAHAPDAPVWLGETGNAQCGGQPGISDAYEGGFWWLDQLGTLAQRGQPVVIRQSLTGASYGLIEEPSLRPRPDYFASVLWKRLMGRRVLRTTSDDRRLRAYAHCAPDGGVAVLSINLDPDRGALVELHGVTGGPVEAFRLEATDGGAGVRLNGRRLEMEGDQLPSMAGVEEQVATERPQVWVPARSFAFFRLPDASHPACGR